MRELDEIEPLDNTFLLLSVLFPRVFLSDDKNIYLQNHIKNTYNELLHVRVIQRGTPTGNHLGKIGVIDISSEVDEWVIRTDRIDVSNPLITRSYYYWEFHLIGDLEVPSLNVL